MDTKVSPKNWTIESPNTHIFSGLFSSQANSGGVFVMGNDERSLPVSFCTDSTINSVWPESISLVTAVCSRNKVIGGSSCARPSKRSPSSLGHVSFKAEAAASRGVHTARDAERLALSGRRFASASKDEALRHTANVKPANPPINTRPAAMPVGCSIGEPGVFCIRIGNR